MASRLGVNHTKTMISFSSNTSVQLQVEIVADFKFKRKDELDKYLGISLIHSRITKDSYRYLVDNVNRKIVDWHGIQLSFAGQITLTKFVLAYGLVYTMQTFRLLHIICDHLDRLIKRFIWQESNDKRKIHLSSWETLCQPKRIEGLVL